MHPFIHLSIGFWLYTVLQCRSSMSSNCLVFHTSGGISSSPRKIYLSLYWKGCVWEASLRLNKDCNILTPPPAPPDIAVCLSRSPGLLNWGPGDPVLCWELVLTTRSWTLTSKLWSPTALSEVLGPPLLCAGSLYSILSPTAQSEVLRAPSAVCWFSLLHLIPN